MSATREKEEEEEQAEDFSRPSNSWEMLRLSQASSTRVLAYLTYTRVSFKSSPSRPADTYIHLYVHTYIHTRRVLPMCLDLPFSLSFFTHSLSLCVCKFGVVVAVCVRWLHLRVDTHTGRRYCVQLSGSLLSRRRGRVSDYAEGKRLKQANSSLSLSDHSSFLLITPSVHWYTPHSYCETLVRVDRERDACLHTQVPIQDRTCIWSGVVGCLSACRRKVREGQHCLEWNQQPLRRLLHILAWLGLSVCMSIHVCTYVGVYVDVCVSVHVRTAMHRVSGLGVRMENMYAVGGRYYTRV